MEDTNNVVSPIYDRVKHQIYDDYERLNRQQALVMGAKTKTAYINALRHFRAKYSKFFNNIFITDVYPNLPKTFREKLEFYAENEKRIKKKEQVRDITFTCGSVLRSINLAKITYTKNRDDIM